MTLKRENYDKFTLPLVQILLYYSLFPFDEGFMLLLHNFVQDMVNPQI